MISLGSTISKLKSRLEQKLRGCKDTVHETEKLYEVIGHYHNILCFIEQFFKSNDQDISLDLGSEEYLKLQEYLEGVKSNI